MVRTSSTQHPVSFHVREDLPLKAYILERAAYYDRMLLEHDEHRQIISGDATTSTDLNKYLYDPLTGCMRGGKRLRPILCELACQLFGGDSDRALSVALSIESFHMACLVHDDMEDRGQMRHGSPCLYLTEGEGIALNVGDYSLALVNSYVLADGSYPAELKVALLEELAQMVARTVQGQALDLGWARDGRFDVGVDDYLDMASRKTACYTVSAPFAAGARVAGADEEDIRLLRQAGEWLGQAFQIHDDLLDFIGNYADTGKRPLSDIRAGKLSYPIVYALNNSQSRAELEDILRLPAKDEKSVRKAARIVESAGALDAGDALTKAHYQRFESALCERFGESAVLDRVLQVAHYLCEREK